MRLSATGKLLWILAAIAFLLLPVFVFAGERAPRNPRVLVFTAQWCIPCKETLYGSSGVKPWATNAGWLWNETDQAHIQTIDVDQRADLVTRHGISTIPALVVIDAKGAASKPVRVSLEAMGKALREIGGK